MNWFEKIVNGVFLIGGLAVICIPNGAVGMGIFFISAHLAPSEMMAAVYSGIGGVIWAQVLFSLIFPIFKLPRLSFKLMLGWYIAYGLGYCAGPLVAAWLHQSLNLPGPIFFSLLCYGGLPLVLAGALKYLGIVGFPQRKFDL